MSIISALFKEPKMLEVEASITDKIRESASIHEEEHQILFYFAKVNIF